MVSSPDFQDFTQASSRLMQQLVGSPVASSVAGVNSVTLPVPDFARSLNLLVTVPANVITLKVVGGTTGFTYLNAVPAYDGGIYYLPAMPVVDSQITITWYQVLATAVSIYAIASDEPISVSTFNPVTPSQSVAERLAYQTPIACPAGVTTTVSIPLDVTTNAIRCSANGSLGYLWGKVVGDSSGIVYFDGSPTIAKFPSTPIPINRIQDNSVTVSLRATVTVDTVLYVSLINAQDSTGSLNIVSGMSPNELVPEKDRNDIPNVLPAKADGVVPISGVLLLVGALGFTQYRLHYLSIMQYTGLATHLELQDTTGQSFFKYHYGAAMNVITVPLFGQVCAVNSGVQLKNMTAVASGAVGVTLWYSVL